MACVGRFSLRLCSIAYSTKFNKVLELKSPVFHIFNKYDSRNLSVSITLKNVSSPLVVYPPTFPESVTEGDIQWQKNVGDFVKEDELIGEIETDKTSLPVRSPSSGKILEFFIENGAKVTKGDKLLTLTLISTPIFLEESSIPVKVRNNEVGSGNFFSNSPSSADLTKSHEAITESTVKPSVLPPSFKINIDEQISRKENRVKIPKIRQTIANRLKESQNTYAMLTTFNEIDMSNFIELRQKYQNDFLKVHGIKLGFMSAFICAASSALQNMPVVNSVIDKNEIVYRDYIDISVAVATQKGLVVPVLRDVQKMNYAHVETLLSQLSDKAKKNQLALEDMDGGTFTISNGGVFGSLMGTPIINPPQSAVLGMHAIVDRPVAISGKVEIRPMMYVALTYDHRLIDGREAVTFLKKIKSYVEDSRLIIMGL